MKSLIFLHYRAGSTFFQHLSGHTPKSLRESLGINSETDSAGYYWMTSSLPKILTRYTDCGSITKLAVENHLTPNFCILTHIGNWWGQLPSREIPLPLESPSPMKWGLSELRPFFYEGWKFVNILRDGRNLIESTRFHRGGVEEELNKQDPGDYFKQLCMAFRNKARVALQTQLLLGRDVYRILKFEDMMEEPLKFMNDLYKFLYDLPADNVILKKKIAQIRAPKNNHSSFLGQTKIEDMKQRHMSWTEQEREMFREIAGKEQEELGYKC